jgi:hypothetical protein
MASEADTRANYIDPALLAAQWQPTNIIREHYFTDGRKLSEGMRNRWSYAVALLNNESSSLILVKIKKKPTPNKIHATSLLNVLPAFDSEDSDLPKFAEDRQMSVYSKEWK